MNKFVMFIWVILVSGIFGVIAMIGYKEKEEQRQNMSYISELKVASQKYLAKKNISLKYNVPEIIFYSDLLESKIIEDEENEHCIKSIVVTKGFIKDEYEINRNCDLNNETN